MSKYASVTAMKTIDSNDSIALSKLTFKNYNLVEVKVRLWLEDNELPALSELTIKDNIKQTFRNMEVLENNLIKSYSFEVKYCYAENNKINFIYEHSGKLYNKNEESTFDEVNILNYSDNKFLDIEGNLYKLYDVTQENLKYLYEKHVQKKYWKQEYAMEYDTLDKEHISRNPLTNPPA